MLPINGSGSALNHTYVVKIRLDYLVHAAVYLPWAVLVWLAVGPWIRSSVARIYLWIILSLIFAASLEIIQRFLPYRAYNINDLIANILGLVLGLLAVAAAGRKRK